MRSRELSPSAWSWFSRSWKTAYGFLSVPMLAFVGTIWHKCCSIPMLPPSFLVHWSWHSALYTVPWLQFSDSCGWADQNDLHFVVWQLCMVIQNVVCLSHHCHHCWNTPLTVLTSTGWSPQMFSKHWWISTSAIFTSWRSSIKHISFIHTSVSDTAPLLPSITWQQHVMDYWWEGSTSTTISSTSTSGQNYYGLT